MAVQKRRQSKARRDSRRAQWMASVKTPNPTACPRCQAPKASHRVCLECGYYDGQKVVDVKEAAE
jgi:large subunit ribosomal protein L32